MSELKMTPTPWKIDSEGDIYSPGHGANGCVTNSMSGYEISPSNAEAIVKAVNNTYGKGINPEFVGDLLTALENILLDAEPTQSGQMLIPKITIKLIKDVIKKAKL